MAFRAAEQVVGTTAGISRAVRNYPHPLMPLRCDLMRLSQRGATVLTGRPAGPRRTNERTSDTFFSDPYEENWAAFNPMRSTEVVARICPAPWAQRPPIDSNRSSKKRSVYGRPNPRSLQLQRVLRCRGSQRGQS